MDNRTAIIGDVHGCLDELGSLLERLALHRSDRLIFLGDFLDKGPRPLDCLRFVIGMQVGLYRAFPRTEVVASNHEAYHARYWRRRQAELAGGPKNRMRGWHRPEDLEVNSQLTEEEVRWLETRPPWVEIIPGWVAVHGGLQPFVPLADQDPEKVVRLRWVSVAGEHCPIDYDAGLPKNGPPPGQHHWSALWEGPQSVVYGHEAFSLSQPKVTTRVGPAGPEVRTYGIDTGCVHGGRLTALVFHAENAIETLQVPAKSVYLPNPEIPA